MEKLKDKKNISIERIGGLFPNCITETRDEDGNLKKAIDFDMLKQMLSDEVVNDDAERYEFTWVGKKASIVEANKATTNTLRPCKEESVDWDNTENLYIEGDNLDVLKMLQESYLGKVKMIYIDPPYNTGNDFIYQDDFRTTNEDYEEDAGHFDEEGDRLVRNTDANGRFHSDWCSMIYSRLLIARAILADEGGVFISMDDNEINSLKVICDEVFGRQNYIATLIWKSKSGGANDSRYFAVDHEYVLVYAKDARQYTLEVDKEATVSTQYNRSDDKGEFALDRLDKQSIRYSEALDYEIEGPDGTIYRPQHKDSNHPNATWRWSKEHVLKCMNELVFENGCVYTKNYKKEGAIPRSLLIEERFGRTRTGKTDCFDLFGANYFSNPKPVKLIRFLSMIAHDPEAIILDFFSGSATTAHAVMQLNAEDGGNRKFIMVQLPEKCDEKSEAYKAGYENICEIGKERIRRAAKKIREENPEAGFDGGFRVFKVDSSNMNDIYHTADAYTQDLLSQTTDNIKADRTDLDLLFDCLLKWGLPLSMPYTSEEVGGCTVHDYNQGDLIACFDREVPETVLRQIAEKKPLRAVFRDSSFQSDADRINVEEIFKLLSPDTTVRVL